MTKPITWRIEKFQYPENLDDAHLSAFMAPFLSQAMDVEDVADFLESLEMEICELMKGADALDELYLHFRRFLFESTAPRNSSPLGYVVDRIIDARCQTIKILNILRGMEKMVEMIKYSKTEEK